MADTEAVTRASAIAAIGHVAQNNCGSREREAEEMLVAAPAAVAGPLPAPTDPMEWPLPCDLTAGSVTIGKGCTLRTVQVRLQVQSETNALLMRKISQQPVPKQNHLFELWWSEYMPETPQDRAWQAWCEAPRTDGAVVAAPQQEAQEPAKLSDEQTEAHGDKASRMIARDLTRFDAACEVDKYLREQGAPGYYRHRMSIVLFGNVEGTEAARAPDTEPQQAPAAQGDALTQAARDVLAERQRQISVEGRTPGLDDEHLPGVLALAAASYVCADEGDAPPAIWPWDWSWWKPRDRRRNLVKSGALVLAELERMDRADAARAAQEGK